MQTEERDAAHLWDMLNAAEHVSQFMQGVSFDIFCVKENFRLQLSVK